MWHEYPGTNVRPRKVNYMILRHRPRHLQPPRIKNFYCISSFHTQKSSIHRELSVYVGRHLPPFCLLIGWCAY